jgi:hypothetical protein
MEPLTDLIKGLEILEPFLRHYNFNLDNYENGKGSGGQFTIATFKNGQKKFIIGYRFSIGELGYQFDTHKVGHTFYLDHLGFGDKKQFPDFQSDDKLIAFRHVLHDFEFIVDDFFIGSCNKLIEASQLQDKFVKEHNQKAQEEYNNHFDLLKIEKARQRFKEKDYKKSLELYRTVEHKLLLNDLDRKTIEYCERHIYE